MSVVLSMSHGFCCNVYSGLLVHRKYEVKNQWEKHHLLLQKNKYAKFRENYLEWTVVPEVAYQIEVLLVKVDIVYYSLSCVDTFN